MMETPVPDSVSAVLNATNGTRDVESEFEAGQEGKIREIVMDNVESDLMVCDFEKHVEIWPLFLFYVAPPSDCHENFFFNLIFYFQKLFTLLKSSMVTTFLMIQ